MTWKSQEKRKKWFTISKQFACLSGFCKTQYIMRLEYEVGRVKKCPAVKCDTLNGWIDQYCSIICHYVVEASPLKVGLDFGLFGELNCHRLEIFDLHVILRIWFGALDFLQSQDFLSISFDVELFFERSDYFVCIYVFFLKFLVVGTALKSISSFNKVRHLLVELVGSELMKFYLLFCLDLIFSLQKSI